MYKTLLVDLPNPNYQNSHPDILTGVARTRPRTWTLLAALTLDTDGVATGQLRAEFILAGPLSICTGAFLAVVLAKDLAVLVLLALIAAILESWLSCTKTLQQKINEFSKEFVRYSFHHFFFQN